MNVKTVGNKQVVYLEGEINAETGANMKAQIIQLFDKSDSVILSFQSVVYMNSSGLREIIDIFKNGQKLKKTISLFGMSKDIREMFSFTGLEKVFVIYETEAEAIGTGK